MDHDAGPIFRQDVAQLEMANSGQVLIEIWKILYLIWRAGSEKLRERCVYAPTSAHSRLVRTCGCCSCRVPAAGSCWGRAAAPAPAAVAAPPDTIEAPAAAAAAVVVAADSAAAAVAACCLPLHQ